MGFVFRTTLLCLLFLSSYLKCEAISTQKNDSIFRAIQKKCESHAKTNFDSAFYYAFKLNSFALETKDKFQVQESYHQIGNIYFYSNKFEKAIEYWLKAAKLNAANGYKHFLVMDYVDVSFAYVTIGEDMFDQAKLWNDKAKEIAMTSADTTLIYYYSKSGIFHLKTGDIEQSLHDFKEVYKFYLAKKWEYRDDMFCSIMNNIGVVYQKMNLLDSSIVYFQKAYEFPNKLPFNRPRAISIVNYGITLRLKGDYVSAIQKTHEGIGDLKQFKLTPKILEGYENIQQCYEKLGKFDSALYYAKKFFVLKDSVFTQNTRKQIANMESLQALEKSNKEVALKDLELERERSNRKVVFLILAVIAITALVFTMAYFIIRNKNKLLNKNEKVIKESLYEKELLLSEVHHRVKNNLQLVSSMLDLQQKYLKDEEAINAINNSKNRVQSMSLIHQTLYQNGKYGYVDTKDYITKVANIVGQSLKTTTTIQMDYHLQSLNLLLDYAIPLGLITNELITNAMKYAFGNRPTGTIRIQFKKEADHLILQVEDDGIGVNELEMAEAKSFGLKLIRSLCRQIDADLSVKNENGTKVKLVIRNFKLYEQV